jgi:HlyD family secretion protein
MASVERRRVVIWGTVGVVLVALLVWALIPRPLPVDVEALTRGPLAVTVEHEGKTRVRERYVISAPVPGRVQRIELEPGDPVVAGDTVLATFEPSDPTLLDARTRAEARAAAEAARSAVARAQAQREQARAEWRFATSELERNRKLVADGIVSRQALESAETLADARREALEAAESALRAAHHDLAAAQARLLEPVDDAASNSPSVLRLRSPVDGVVLRRIRESAAVIPTGETLLEVADPADLEMVADFLSTDAVKIRPGMQARIDRWGGDEVLEGRVRRVDPSGYLKISALGVEEQRVDVVVDFDDPREAWEALGDEYRIEVAVVIWQTDDALRLPVSALFRHQEGWAVYTVRDGRGHLTPVEIGHRSDLTAEVLKGLEAGEKVVVHPPDGLEDGWRVEGRG